MINTENKLIKLQIWDTAGQDRFKSITKTYYKGAHGILLVYDVTERESFLKIQHWMKQIETHAKGNVCKVLVGNKCDKTERQISEEEGKKCACDNHINFYETSAKTGLNVDEVFMFITKEIVKNLTPPEAKNININDPKVDQEHNKCCK